MRQLNETGWMHNRLRMITASFLVKDLLIDWRIGERYFISQLIDGDLARITAAGSGRPLPAPMRLPISGFLIRPLRGKNLMPTASLSAAGCPSSGCSCESDPRPVGMGG
jgi:hypothetical protein